MGREDDRTITSCWESQIISPSKATTALIAVWPTVCQLWVILCKHISRKPVYTSREPLSGDHSTGPSTWQYRPINMTVPAHQHDSIGPSTWQYRPINMTVSARQHDTTAPINMTVMAHQHDSTGLSTWQYRTHQHDSTGPSTWWYRPISMTVQAHPSTNTFDFGMEVSLSSQP